MEFAHIPVLLEQCLDGLDIKPDGIYFAGTCGGAGHSREIAKRLTTGRLIGIDRDPDAVAVASERLSGLRKEHLQGISSMNTQRSSSQRYSTSTARRNLLQGLRKL